MTIKIIRKENIRILKTKETNLKFRLKKIDETRNYLLEEIKYNYFLNEKYERHVREVST